MFKTFISKMIDFCLVVFILYMFFSTLHITTELLNGVLNLENATTLAFILLMIFIYGYINKYIKMEQEVKDIINLCNTLYLLDYSRLKNIEKITVSCDYKGIAMLKNGSIRTIDINKLPKTQDDLIKIDNEII